LEEAHLTWVKAHFGR